MDLTTKTLNEVSELYRTGVISRAEADAYVVLWNNGPHFTTAVVRENHIANMEATDNDA